MLTALLISIFSLMVVSTTAFILYYKTDEIRIDTFNKIQNIINQVNDSQYYGYSFDKKQEQNIKNLDANIENVHKSLLELQNNVKFLERNAVNKNDQATKVSTNLLDSTYVKTKSAIIGNGTLQNNMILEAGRTSDGKNEGYSAINFNGYTEDGDKLINSKKSRWRVVTDQTSSSDKFGIDQYNPDKTSWNYMWMSDGSVTLNNNKLRISNKWTGWPNNAKDQAEISNDPSVGKLMIVGNKSSGEGIRKVGIWDHLDVHGNQNTTGINRATNLMATTRFQMDNNSAFIKNDGYMEGQNIRARNDLLAGNQVCIGDVCLTRNDLLKLKALK